MSFLRRKTKQVRLTSNLVIGSDYPIVIQSMTNTPTQDILASAEQVKNLFLAGSSAVRLTVKDEPGALAIPEIKAKLLSEGLDVPLVGDFHYNGHLLLAKFPKCAEALVKYRINPGNVGYGDKHDYNFDTIIKIAKANDKAVRIGVNWGSLDQDLLTEFMEINSNKPLDARLGFKEVIYQAMQASALRSAEQALSAGLADNKIIISVKMSEVPDLINIYRLVAKACDFPLHLGLT